MNRNQIISIALFTGVALAAGYWWGHTTGTRGHESPSVTSTGGTTDAAEGGGTAGQPRRILYYRNPMGLNDTSPVPKKDAMGMDYIPVYDGDVPDGPQVKISLNRLQTLGVKTEAAASRSMSRTIRAVGTIEASERGLYTVSPKFEGWITTLHVNTTGATVRRGQPLLAVYSPELVTAQEEYRVAAQTLQSMHDASPEARANMQSLVEGGLQRLRNWDIADADLAGPQGGEGRPAFTAAALTSGRRGDRAGGPRRHALHAGRGSASRLRTCRACGSWPTCSSRTCRWFEPARPRRCRWRRTRGATSTAKSRSCTRPSNPRRARRASASSCRTRPGC